MCSRGDHPPYPHTLSRGIACQAKGGQCPEYAHEEWVDRYSDPVGSGLMLCHGHSDLRRAELGQPPRLTTADCVECHPEIRT